VSTDKQSEEPLAVKTMTDRSVSVQRRQGENRLGRTK